MVRFLLLDLRDPMSRTIAKRSFHWFVLEAEIAEGMQLIVDRNGEGHGCRISWLPGYICSKATLPAHFCGMKFVAPYPPERTTDSTAEEAWHPTQAW